MRKLLIETTPLNSEDYDAINSLDNSSSTDDESNGSRGCAGTDHPWYEEGLRRLPWQEPAYRMEERQNSYRVT